MFQKFHEINMVNYGAAVEVQQELEDAPFCLSP